MKRTCPPTIIDDARVIKAARVIDCSPLLFQCHETLHPLFLRLSDQSTAPNARATRPERLDGEIVQRE